MDKGADKMDIYEILKKCDHTLLRPDCSSGEIIRLCDQGIRYRVASVCIPPCHVSGAKRYVGSRLPICTVIGFPNGYSTSKVKAYEAADAIACGADEIDMVIDIPMVRDRYWSAAAEDIAVVRRATEGKILKVIIETCLLTRQEKIELCDIISDSGADFIKTSTGFGAKGATREDVALLRQRCASHVRIKAAGGISTLEDAQDFIELGADRLGTSRIVRLAMDMGL